MTRGLGGLIVLDPECLFRIQKLDASMEPILALELLLECSPIIGEDGMSCGLQKDSCPFRYLISMYHKDPARLVPGEGICANRYQAHNIVLKLLPVPCAVAVPDHQINRQTHGMPVGMSPHKLVRQIDVRSIPNLEKDNWDVARDTVCP